MSKARDEKIKLTASWFNSLSIAAFSVGVATPAVAYILNLGNAQQFVSLAGFSASTLLWLVFSVISHGVARKILDKMDAE